MELKTIEIGKEEDMNVIVGQSHFIKTVEDLYEALVTASPDIEFGIAFCEASGDRLIRFDGNDEDLKELAVENAQNINAGHCFVILLKNAYPINVLSAVKNLQEVCSIFCATANPVEIIVAEEGEGRGILGVIDGKKTVDTESKEDKKWRKDLLKDIGYKR